MLQRVTADHFDMLYDIMKDSFPTDELRPYGLQRALFEREDYCVYGQFDGARLQGFLAVYALEPVLFVEHFAVARTERGCGLGSRLLRELKARSERPLCLEVELPTTETAKRRIAFYRRNGFFFHDDPYVQPPLAEGQRPVELRLMTTERPLDEAELQKIKSLLYTSVYRQSLKEM